MSIHSVKQYQSEVEKIIHFGGTKKETAIRTAFHGLLNEYAKQKGLMLIPEISIKGSKGKTVIPDGTLKDSLRLDWGYWESKDEADNIDEEIEKKFKKGYPKDNILFEDSNTAILIQQSNEVMRIKMDDAEALDRIIHEFINYERPEVENFHKAIELFKQDIPHVTDTIKGIILAQEKANSKFKQAENKFWELCKESINPLISLEDIREMMIQHILTEDIFNTIFGETQFHRENNIARELEQVILTFFTGNTKHIALDSIQHYYKAINAAAAQIADHHEKQKFLKVIYEVFYKGYNPKAADRLGVVYTPNEVVRFMVDSVDYLLDKHFNKSLEDKNVDILDPATGTGTFICDIIDKIKKDKLEYKYTHEIHANEVAILPYYIANLNIEYTYKQKTGQYKEYDKLCFVDTLDNMGFGYAGKQTSLFAVSAENAERIKRQNSKKISVIIGNPPYNAKQENYNYQNANRAYLGIDKRIKDSYIAHGTAQNQSTLYDMYVRFFRWATDRLDKNGIIAFISNNSFLDGKAFDGFRKLAAQDFNEIHIINLKGNARNSGERRKQEGGNIFSDEIKVGVAVYFFIRKEGAEGCKIYYNEIDDYVKGEDKKIYLSENTFKTLSFNKIVPDNQYNWINQSETDFEQLIPLISKDVKASRGNESLFKLFTNGIQTNRDEWVYDLNEKSLCNKMNFFCERYIESVEKSKMDMSIKWSSSLEAYFISKIKTAFNKDLIIRTIYRPFFLQYHYTEKLFNHRLTENHYETKGKSLKNDNILIVLPGLSSSKDFHTLASKYFIDLNCLPAGCQYIPLYRYGDNQSHIDNITDWGLIQFQTHYENNKITKLNIFHYVYAVLHNPSYCSKYQQNLKRDFPRIPFYDDFNKWAAWGKALIDLHINYETAKPFKLKEVIEKDIENPKPKLKADQETNQIIIDEKTTLSGIPAEAWEYKLGNRNALEWVLEMYKESKISDPTIAEKFNTYHFADYKPQVIDLLKRICTVSVETMKIISQMG